MDIAKLHEAITSRGMEESRDRRVQFLMREQGDKFPNVTRQEIGGLKQRARIFGWNIIQRLERRISQYRNQIVKQRN
jgi:hypothetical protein